jgi:hypothetical protein
MNTSLVHVPLQLCFSTVPWKMWLLVTFVCHCAVIQLFVKEKQLKCSDRYVHELVPPVLEGGWREMEMTTTDAMNMSKYDACYTCSDFWHCHCWWKLLLRSEVTACSGMACCFQTRCLELYCWPAWLWSSVDCILVNLWPKVGTISTALFADVLYQLSCPCSEKAPVEADLSCCTFSQVHLIAVYMFMIFLWPVPLLRCYLFLSSAVLSCVVLSLVLYR